jgi:hypothetical protein
MVVAVLAGGAGTYWLMSVLRNRGPRIKRVVRNSSEVVINQTPFPRARRMRWTSGTNEGVTNKGYSEIGKGPDRPARSRPAGKVGMCNSANRTFSDWKTSHIENRAAGRKDAHNVKRAQVVAKKRKPKPK